MIINRAGRENSENDYHEEIMTMINLTNDNEPLFLEEEKKFLQFLVNKNKVVLFKQAAK
jgi:hypothetical protein